MILTKKALLKNPLYPTRIGSIEKAVAAHLADPESAVNPEELKRLSALIAEARKNEH